MYDATAHRADATTPDARGHRRGWRWLAVLLAALALTACGPDRRGGSDDDCDGDVDCPFGEVCDDGECVGDSSNNGGNNADPECAAFCAGRECGDATCDCGPGCGADELCDVDGACVPLSCDAPPAIGGTVTIDGTEIPFDAAAVGLTHKRDADQSEDGCIASVDITLTLGEGCRLRITAGDLYVDEGALEAQLVELTADSFCPGFEDSVEGVYTDTGGLTLAEVQLSASELDEHNVAESCQGMTLTIRLAGELNRADDATLTVADSTLSLNGGFRSSGDADASCPCLPMCDGRECGDDGCGGQCGQCNGEGEACAGGQCACAFESCDGQCCPEGESCSDTGQCCLSSCDGVECGDDACGNACGTCGGANETCVNHRCTCEAGAIECGGECIVCDDPHGEGSCGGGQCQIDCDPGYHLCSNVCVRDDSVNSCGDRCDPCPTDPLGTATCTDGVCGIACDGGARMCGGGCAACPDVGVAETACNGVACVATGCETGYSLVGGACQGWTSETARSGRLSIRGGLSMARSTGGELHVCYTTYSSGVQYGHRTSDGTWTFETVEDVDSGDCVVVVSDGDTPHIAFIDQETGEVRYGLKFFGSWSLETVGVNAWVWDPPALALHREGEAALAWSDNSTAVGVIYAERDGGPFVTQPVGIAGYSPSLVFFADHPRISFSKQAVYYAENLGDGWTVDTIHSGGEGHSSVLRLNDSVDPYVMWTQRSPHGLGYAFRPSTSWVVTTSHIDIGEVEYVGDMHFEFGPDGAGHIAYAVELPTEPGTAELYHAALRGGFWNVQPVGVSDISPSATAMVLDDEGRPWILYAGRETGLHLTWLE